jgi:hypothetical protein
VSTARRRIAAIVSLGVLGGVLAVPMVTAQAKANCGHQQCKPAGGATGRKVG